MDLYVIRHAKAEEESRSGGDAERALTADGRQAALAVGGALARHGAVLDEIVASPLVRAVETAELIAVALSFDGALGIDRALAPPTRPGQILDQVLEPLYSGGCERAAIVGHEPSLGDLCSALLGRPGLALGKGTCVRLAWDGRRAQLVWVITPKRLEPRASLDGL